MKPSMSAAEMIMLVKMRPPASGWRAIDSTALLAIVAMPRAAPKTTRPTPTTSRPLTPR